MSRPKVITLAPSALDRNGISTTETLLATRLDFLINGALSAGYDRNGICAAQTTSASAALSLNGALGIDFHTRRGIYVLIFAASADNTGITFAVVGENEKGNRITETITGPDSGLIVLGSTKFYHVTSITSSAAVDGNVEVGVNGYASFSTSQHVAQYSAGDDTGDTYTVYGEDRYGFEVTDSITGVSAGTSTTQNQNFSWVNRIASSGASAGAVESGVDGLCESAWYQLNYRGAGFNVGVGCDISSGASLTYAVQHTFSALQSVVTPPVVINETDAVVFTHSTITGKTANFEGTYTSPPRALRLALTAHSSGSANARVVQVGQS